MKGTSDQKKTITPVVLFAYNRHRQLAKTLACLQSNSIPLLYVFVDGAKFETDRVNVEIVRKMVDEIRWTKVIKVYADANKGLSRSIQDGLNNVFEKHDKAIVIEDDICVAPGFYEYMTACLNNYADSPHIAGVTGLRYPFSRKQLQSDPYDIFLTPRFASWGWATWKRVWEDISFDSDKLMRKLEKKDANLAAGGNDLPYAIEELAAGRLTGCWDVYFYMNMLARDQYFVWPKQNYIINTGLQEGSHASDAALPAWKLRVEKRPKNLRLPKNPSSNDKILGDFLAFFEPENLNKLVRGPLMKPALHKIKQTIIPKAVLNKIANKAGYHISRVQAVEPSEAATAPGEQPQQAEPTDTKLNPEDYSTTDDPQEVPCQKETYYHALNNLITPASRVLDVGSGLGYGMGILSVVAKEVQGVDVDKKAVDYAKRELVGRNPKVKNVRVYDGYSLPFDDNSFDTVTCVDVLEHVEDYDRFIDELLRVTKKYVLFGTPNRRPEFTNEDGTPKNFWHLREWSHQELDTIFSKHAAKVDWHFIDGPWEGPFKIGTVATDETMVLMPLLRKTN